MTDSDDFNKMKALIWAEGYSAGWKDNELDLPEHHTENPYKEPTND